MSLAVSRERFVDYIKQPEDKAGALTEDTTYYVDLFDKYYNQEPQIVWFLQWNWAACILGPVWLAYRGMFWIAVLVIVVIEAMKLFDIVLYFVGIAIFFPLIGAYGNALYLAHVENWIVKENQFKKGVDVPLSCCVLVLFFCNTATRLIGQLFI